MTTPRVCQFAGHGGSGDTRHERGYISHDRMFFERHWTLALSRDLHTVMEHWGVEPFLGRFDDSCITHIERGRIASAWNASLVIEHHVNAHTDAEMDGIMCFVRSHDHVAMEVAEAIARAAPKQLLRRKARAYVALPTNWTKDAYACMHHHGDTPTVLIEWGFATSSRDLATLTAPTSRPAIVASFFAGIGRYHEVI